MTGLIDLRVSELPAEHDLAALRLRYWRPGVPFLLGDYVYIDEEPYVALLAHFSDGDRRPASGPFWQTYWERASRPDAVYYLDDGSVYVTDSDADETQQGAAEPVVSLGGTALTISKVRVLFGDFHPGSKYLTSLSMPDLVTVAGSMFFTADIDANLDLLQTLDLPLLETVTGNCRAAVPALTSVDLSALSEAGGFGLTAASLTTMSLPRLVTVHEKWNGQMGSLTSLSLPLLATVGSHFDPTLTVLTTLSLPSIVSIGGDFDIYSEEITTLTLNSELKQIGGVVNLEQVGKLGQSSVDGILVRLAALDGTNGTTSFDNSSVDLSGGTNASPSATGLAAKATLEGRGNIVTVN